MSDLFDPYHKWLGIPKEDQPANHYRLLGLRDFEADPDVIDLAANKQMIFLHSCSTGEHSDDAEQLLNEIAAARLCLLGIDTKQSYDEKLRARLSPDSSGTAITSSSLRRTRKRRLAQNPQTSSRVDDEVDDVLDVTFDGNTKAISVRSLARTRRQGGYHKRAANRLRPIVGVCIVLVLVAIGFLLSRGDPPEPASIDTRDNDSIASNDPSVTAGDSIAGSGPSVADDEYGIELFNGKNLTGWTARRPDGNTVDPASDWTVRSGVIRSLGQEHNWLESDERYDNFVFSFEWRFPVGTERGVNGSGVVIRSSGLNKRNFDPRGIEIDLRPGGSSNGRIGTGCLVTYDTFVTHESGATPASGNGHLACTQSHVMQPFGQWNLCEIRCDGNNIEVFMEGRLVNQVYQPTVKPGRICLRNQKTVVEFRNLTLRSADDQAAPDAVSLSDSDDWDDWRCQQQGGLAAADAGGWQLDGSGVLSATGLPGYGNLFTAREFTDFELSLDYRLTAGANSGILFQATGGGGMWGDQFLEVQLLDDDGWRPKRPGLVLKPEQRNGSLYGMAAPWNPPEKPAGQWNSLVLKSVGSQVSVTLNGSQIIDLDLLTSPETQPFLDEKPALRRRSGLIGLQKHGGSVSFRNIRIRELTAAKFAGVTDEAK